MPTREDYQRRAEADLDRAHGDASEAEREFYLARAQVYATLAISAQPAEG